MVTSKSGLLSVLPSDVKTKILSKLTDDAGNAKQVDRISDSEMQRMVDAGYDRQTIKQLENGQFKAKDLRAFSAKNVNLDRVKTLRNRGIPADDIRYYVDNDVSLHKVADMRNQQFSPEQIRKLSDEGFDFRKATDLKREGFTNDDVTTFAEKGTDPNTVKQLKYEEFTNDEITTIVKKGADPKQAGKLKREGYATEEITHLVKKSERSYLYTNDILRQVQKRTDDGIPKSDINYYVENGVSLKLVGTLHDSGKSSNKVKAAIQRYVQKNPVEVRRTVESMRYNQDYSIPILNAIVNGGVSAEVRKDKQKTRQKII